MRKFYGLIAGLSLLVLTSCNWVLNAVAPQFPEGTTGALEAGVWTVRADSSLPGFVIGSSADIQGERFDEPCRFVPVAAGERRALACNAPNRVQFSTTGTPWVQVLDAPPNTKST
jgi:hypothetical protein